MKQLILVLVVLSFAFGAVEKVEIESLRFEADESRGVSTFSENVVIKKGEDRMYADEVRVYVDQENQIERFEADGNTSFLLHMEDNSSFEGRSDHFVYLPKDGELVLTGNARINDRNNSRQISGETVILDEKTKQARVIGESDRPVKLIFEMQKSEKK